ncbi:type IV-A pilus assembly ATPase PilB [Salinisphaera sp. USBA-960]|uniref:type IV-A pilus assembly ATPase PilB n=1 Tax=Salinisphaera orenii TaxID=856731 RepID=UPI000DBE69A0|nr:type IV-A pilus assembly ATPase PilB [Salifodinibacter halophilus]NNC25918.1 type IV-A pilus assembly ATPase PilB [Salifodinibacter halophilus]
MGDEHKQPPLGGLSRRLVNAGVLEAEYASDAQRRASRSGISLVSFLASEKAVDPLTLAEAVSEEFATPLVDLSTFNITDHAPLDEVSDSLIRKLGAFPLYRRGKVLYIAVCDPMNQSVLDEFKFNTGCKVMPVVVEYNKLAQLLESESTAIDNAVDGLSKLAPGGTTNNNEALDSSDDTEGDGPVVEFVHKVMRDAIRRGASDIHFEPYEKNYRVRIRKDGVLEALGKNPPAEIGNRLGARLKVMARLDLAERRIPQDGRLKFKLSQDNDIDFRVSTCPTLHGEKVVLRILDPASARMGIDQLGYEHDQRALFESTIHKPYGMVLVTGPTGSGKTVSLYTALNILNTDNRNISTAEDPAEINLPGINQVNVHPGIGLTFPTCLRAFLRQDPDVIMVGEIRDLETAEIAIKAAQTGHMVLSTLHTNNAPQTLSRLINMGVAGYNIASTVSLIIAQRLARKLCERCKQPATIPHNALLEEGFAACELDSLEIFEANHAGCDRCSQGYSGRTGIYETLPISEAMGTLIMEGGTGYDLEKKARAEGVMNLHQAGLNKVRQGIVDLAEVKRVTID